MQDILLRRADRHDVGAIAQLSKELGYSVSLRDMSDRFARLMMRSDHAIFVVTESEDAVIGWIHICIAERLESPAFAELGGLVVTEQRRGQGIGSRLVAAAEHWAQQSGLGRLRIRSNVSRDDAHAFFRRLGYEHVKTQAIFQKQLQKGDQ